MPECERIDKCPYFIEHLTDLKGNQDMWKEKFCKVDNSNCARYMVFKVLGQEQVPRLLLPTDVDKAKELIQQVETNTVK